MDFVELNVKPREEVGKEKAKKLRGKGEIPAVMYGHKAKNQLFLINEGEFNYLGQHGGTGGIFKLTMEGEKKAQNAIIKEIQKDPLSDRVLHVDFMKIAMDEAVTTVVSVVITGESPGVKAGGVLQHGVWELNVKALPKDLPSNIEVNVSSMEVGDLIKVKDLPLPEGVEVLNSPEELIVSVVPPSKIVEEKVEVEGVEKEVSEPEVIGAKETEQEK
ncbi:MAG TPA: 50S ribosomal protein L25 [Actinobacteria bacterium]|nr:50S ribosomal protein L25 [Actinomycetota bacterium]